MNPKQVLKKIKVDNNKDSVEHAIDKLEEAGKIQAVGDYNYKLKERQSGGGPSTFHEGKVDMTKSGSAYIICDDREDDVHIAPKYVNNALHGDRVKIRAWVPRGRRRPEGEVIEVIERAREHFLGTAWHYPNKAIVVPDGVHAMDIEVSFDHLKGAQDGEKVVVKILDWGDPRKSNSPIVGEVTSVLGKAGSNDIEMKSILINSGFQLDFPDEVMVEAKALPTEITEDEVDKRLDYRDVTTFTIDPLTAKDFDDALSIKKLENGDTEIGIHIADVTHYVQSGTALDKEAFERSTSVYLVDRVLPMLPEKISNELCSLRPNEDKLTFSAIFTFNKQMKVTKRWFGKAVIHSDRRFTYEEAQEVLETKQGDYAEELLLLNKIAYKLRDQRFKEGAINFETDEVQFKLDEEGKPIEIYLKVRQDAHMLVEDFMLLANREVATFIHKKGGGNEVPFVYRVHDQPNPDKVEEFARFTKELGFDIDFQTGKTLAESYNKLAKAAETDPGLRLILPLAIRTMAKAEYTTNNIGHYGLGFEFYSHFTSPIRRYSDVLAHRILEKNLSDGMVFRLNKDRLEEKCAHVSAQERKAMEAERESVKYKQVEYIENHIGEVFEGFISGIIDRGIFVELKGSRIEGMVSFESMHEIFTIDSSKMKFTGFSSEKTYKVGDLLKVKILEANRSKRQIEMEWIVDEE